MRACLRFCSLTILKLRTACFLSCFSFLFIYVATINLSLTSKKLACMQGSVYKRVNPEREIKSVRSDEFWVKLQVISNRLYVL